MPASSSFERLSHILSVSPAIIYACRAYGDFGATFVSENINSLGYTVDDCLKTPSFWRDNLHPDDADAILKGFEVIYEQGQLAHEYRFRKKDGSYIWIHDTVRLIYDEQGQPFEIIGSWLDVDARRIAEDKLYEVYQSKSEFLSKIAHELRTPVAGIMGYMELLADEANENSFSSSEKREFQAEVQKNCARLAQTIDDLLDWSRIEAGRGISVRKKTAPVLPFMENLVKNLNYKFSQNIQLTIGTLDLDCLAYDDHRLEQVFLNLVGNASKYSQPTSDIRISVHQDDSSFHFQVTDQGLGMTEEELQHIFERFYRTESASSNSVGFGIGMGIVKEIVEEHGGEISISSVAGKGTTVSFSIPLEA